MRNRFTRLLEFARRVFVSRVIRIGLMLIVYALLAHFGLPLDQASPLADAIHGTIDYVLLAGIAAMMHYRVKAKRDISAAPSPTLTPC